MEIIRYVSANGRIVVNDWLTDLRDARAAVKIAMRINRLASGHFGDCKPLRDGVWELRIDSGPGYRLYYARIGQLLILLLCGGDKGSQSVDIARAVNYLEDYKRRVKS